MRYKIGDVVWAAHFDPLEPIKIPCSVCNGDKKVTLILGNGDRIYLTCGYCGNRNMGIPTGYEEEYRSESKPKAVHIDAIEIEITEEGEKVTYKAGSNGVFYLYPEDMVFSDYNEALKKGEELKEKDLHEQKARAAFLKADVTKSFAWNAGYHRKEAKRLKSQIAYHEEKASLCKAREK